LIICSDESINLQSEQPTDADVVVKVISTIVADNAKSADTAQISAIK
jgi:hypothetical protein